MFFIYNGYVYENFSSDEAVQSIASLYNQGGNLVINQVTTTSDINVGSNLNMKPGTKINSDGRLHIGSGELLYLLPKNGVIIGKEWGGNGNLNVQGTLTSPTLISTTATIDNLTAKNATVTGDLVANQTATFNGNVNANGRVKFRTFENTNPAGGWDLGDFVASSATDCANQCQSKYPTSVNAGFKKSERRCWCKSLMGHSGKNTDWTTMFFI